MSQEEQLEQELSTLLEAKRELEQLLDTRGWRRLVGIVQQQTDALQQEILFTPCKDIDSTLTQEYKKGQLEGRLSISGVVEAELDTLDISINHARSKLNEWNRDSTGRPDTNRAP